MAEGLGEALGNLISNAGQGGGQTQDPNTPIIATNTQNIAGGIEGLTAVQNRAVQAFESMNTSMKDQYVLLTKMVDSLVAIRDFAASEETPEDRKEADVVSAKKEPDESDLTKLPDRYAMPGLLVHKDLVEFKGSMEILMAELIGIGTQGLDNARGQNDELLTAINELIGTSERTGTAPGGTSDELMTLVSTISGQIDNTSTVLAANHSELMVTLSEILGKLDGMAGEAAGVKPKDKKEGEKDKNAEGEKGKGGIKKIFSDLMKGVEGIGKMALALIGFAAAAAIFVLIPWGPAMVGLAMFALFIAGVILIAHIVSKMELGKKMYEFLDMVFIMTLAFVAFGVAMMLMSIVAALVGPAILGAFVMMGFFFLFMIVSILISKLWKVSNVFFGEAVFGLSAALILFTVAMMLMPIAAMIAWSNIPSILAILGMFLLFAFLGSFISPKGKGGGGIKDFAKGCIQLALALIIFTVTMVILFLLATRGFLGIVPPMMSPTFWVGPLLITAMFLLFVALGVMIGKRIDDLKKFAIGAILLTVGLILFAIGLLVLNWVYKKLIESGPLIEFGQFKIPFSVILIMGLFLAFIAIGAVASKAMGDMIKFAIASILMTIGLVLFAIALNLLIDAGERILQKPLAFIIPMLTFLVLLVLFTVIGAALASGAIIGIALFAVGAILMSVGLLLFGVALNLLLDVGERVLENPMALVAAMGAMAAVMIGMALLAVPAAIAIVAGALFLAASILLVPALILWGQAFKLMMENTPDTDKIDQFMSMIKYTMGQFGFGMAIAAAKALIGGVAALAATLLIMGVFVAAGRTFDIAIDIYKKTREYDVDELMKPSIDLIHKIASIGKNLKGVSLESAEAFKVILDATLGAMERIVAMMDALADPKMKEKIPPAQEAFRMILDKFFGVDPKKGGWTGDPLTLIGLMRAIAKSGVEITDGQKRAAEALVPLTQALGNITDMIVKLQAVDVDAGVASIRKMLPFMTELTRFATIFKSDGMFRTGSEEQFAIAKKSIDSMIPMIDSIQVLVDKVSPLKGASEEGAEAVRQSMKLITEITRFAEQFKAGGWFTKSSSEQFKVAKDSIDAMMPLLASVDRLAQTASRIEYEGSFPQFGETIKVNVIDSLVELDEAIRRVESFDASMKRLNTTLKAFVKDNQDAIRGGNGFLDKAAQFAINVKNAVTAKIGGTPTAGAAGAAGATGGKDPIDSIAKNVSAIAKKMMAPGADEWGGAVK